MGWIDMEGVGPVVMNNAALIGTIKRLERLVVHAPARGIFALCEGLFIEWSIGPKQFARKIDFTAADIEIPAEARLRAARLYREDGTQSLAITVLLGKEVFSVKVALKRSVEDTGYGISGVVTIWETGYWGSYDSKATIQQAISQGLDAFLAVHRRINDPACRLPQDQLPIGPASLKWLHDHSVPVKKSE